MTLSETSKLQDGEIWRCQKKTNGKICNASKSIRTNSWFSRSKLCVEEILQLTYDIVLGLPAHQLLDETGYSSATLADWRSYIREVLIDYVELHSEKLGGPGKIVEIDECKFGKRKYSKRHPIEGPWVFGGVECELGKMFFVAVHDRSAKTLLSVIKQSIEPGSD